MNAISLKELKKEFLDLQDKEKAKLLEKFFKTGKGEYAEGDVFLGLVVPKQRALVKRYWNALDLEDLQELLNSKFHEHRLTSLLILVKQYEKYPQKRREIFDFYLGNTKNINNWDLVDLSAPNIVGAFLLDKKRDVLYELAKSNHLWERRISILATAAFIRNDQFEDTLEIAEILLQDRHDLIHKAVGWMLREVGKRDISALKDFLNEHAKSMPRTMLRYAIEKFPEKLRKSYLAK